MGLRAESTEATRHAIIEAARDLLVGRQWSRFTVDAVAKRASVTRVTVYNQVRSKSGLLDAVLTDLTERARMNRLLTDTEHLTPAEARTAIVRRTCHFWQAEREILRVLFGLAALDLEVAATLARREQWRSDQLLHLVRRSAARNAPFAEPDLLAAILAVTSFPTYDSLGPAADDPDRATALLDHLVRALTG